MPELSQSMVEPYWYVWLVWASAFLAVWALLYARFPRQRRAMRWASPYTTTPFGLAEPLCHPQYTGFVLIMFGFLLQWPTLLTLAVFPVLVVMYARLARREEREVAAAFGAEYAAYAARTPAFLPRRRTAGAV